MGSRSRGWQFKSQWAQDKKKKKAKTYCWLVITLNGDLGGRGRVAGGQNKSGGTQWEKENRIEESKALDIFPF